MTYLEAISHFKTPANLARAVGINRASVAGWKKHGIPIGRQYQLELLTGGALTVTLPVATAVSSGASSLTP